MQQCKVNLQHTADGVKTQKAKLSQQGNQPEHTQIASQLDEHSIISYLSQFHKDRLPSVQRTEKVAQIAHSYGNNFLQRLMSTTSCNNVIQRRVVCDPDNPEICWSEDDTFTPTSEPNMSHIPPSPISKASPKSNTSSHQPRTEHSVPYWSAGQRPDERPGPYAHASVTDGSLQLGVGGFHEDLSDGAKIDVLSANFEGGRFGSSLDNTERYGFTANAQQFSGTTGTGGHFGFDGGVFGASGEASAGQDGAALGGGAYIIQGAARAGDTTKSEVNDEQLRFGLGAGPGLGFRGYWGDQDKDRVREVGFGADIGPVSFDIKTEDPLLTIAKAGPLLGAFGWAADLLTDDKDTNFTRSALGLLGIDW